MTASLADARPAAMGARAPLRRLAHALRRVRRDPAGALAGALALARGRWYKAWYPLRGVRFTAGRGLRVYGRLDVRGPGSVEFGDDVLVVGRARPWTHAADARLRVGSRVSIGDAEIGCAREVVIGDGCRLARCYIMDTDFHSTRADREAPGAPVRVAPVRLEENVWVGHFAGVLPGSRIGRNSVVAFGAVCMREYPADVVLIGNPARVAAPVLAAPGAAAPDRPPEVRPCTP
jgi:acetyltransferase-like isoleucine patch superfamily enzyme